MDTKNRLSEKLPKACFLRTFLAYISAYSCCFHACSSEYNKTSQGKVCRCYLLSFISRLSGKRYIYITGGIIMAIFERIKDLLKANINDLLDRAEDPEKMLKQIIIDMEQSLDEAVKGLAQAMASEKQMARQMEAAQSQSADWESKARMALGKGDQELAKQAVANKLKSEGNARQYGQMHETLVSQTQALRMQVEELKARIEEARGKQAILTARAQVAGTQKQFAKTVSGTDSNSAFAKMEKMEKKVEQEEAEAAAWTELSGESDSGSFKKLEEESAVEAELNRLMAGMEKQD
jgi:phage shock protein A